MPFTKYANLDFDQIKQSIKDYLRANSDFSDFDFEGSNFSVLLDTLAYNTYITAFNANMTVNESFIESASLRENVVSLARNIGYVPRSRTAAKAQISFQVKYFGSSPTVTLKAGLVCVGNTENSNYVFSISEDITTTAPLDNPTGALTGNRTATFNNITINQGTFAKRTFRVDTSLDQRFILENSFVDTETIRVRVKGPADTGIGDEFVRVDNIVQINKDSKIYFIQEVKDERYELLFGDDILGKKLENDSSVVVGYIITDGSTGNGVSSFSFAGTMKGSANENIIPASTPTVTVSQKSQGGTEIESVQSIKYFAPRTYSSQYRAVTARDYETIVKQIYPQAESVSVVGGEELDPPRFGEVEISIKPKNEYFVSDFNKQLILNQLKQYSLAGIRQSIVDLEILTIEIDSFVYYNNSKVTNIEDLKASVSATLSDFADSEDLNNFGGRFKYSKLLNVIDNTNTAITSNITKVKIRRDLKATINRPAQYELCFGNQFHVEKTGNNIKSTGFTISGIPDTLYMTDTPASDGKTGVISFVKIGENGQFVTVVQSAGSVDYMIGEINIFTTNIISTQIPGGIIEIQAFPESNDIIGLQNLFVELSTAKSTINMVKDTISSGEQISGIGFPVTSSYSNGKLTR